jgi:hypothetical protein
LPFLGSAKHNIPVEGTIPVAFVITDDVVTIGFAWPWEVFKDVFLEKVEKTLHSSVELSLQAP